MFKGLPLSLLDFCTLCVDGWETQAAVTAALHHVEAGAHVGLTEALCVTSVSQQRQVRPRLLIKHSETVGSRGGRFTFLILSMLLSFR